MKKKILYHMDYLDTDDEDEQMLRDCMPIKFDEGNGLSAEVQASLAKFLIDQTVKDNEPIADEVSEECEIFIIKCKYISEIHYHNIEIYQTSREVVANFKLSSANYHDFDELYPIAHKIEFGPYNSRLCSVKFTYDLREEGGK